MRLPVGAGGWTAQTNPPLHQGLEVVGSPLDVAVVGGGPVGLYLGCRLAQLGLRFRVFEKNAAPQPHSRSIGIHPPSLELFEDLGVVEGMLGRGVLVRRGRAFAGRRPLGILDFSQLGGRHPYILTLPQDQTEAVLEGRLHELAPGALARGVEVLALECAKAGTTLRYRQGSCEVTTVARFVVGADGKDSMVRRAAGIAYTGGPYPDSYLMGDFADTTDLGPDAAVYLTREGLVESFPLPGGRRRWVAKTERYARGASARDLCQLIDRRLGHAPPVKSNSMLSAFGVQHYLAACFGRGRLLLAGDAAHVLSPIGGQGMNLGWLDGAVLTEVLAGAFTEGEAWAPLLARFDRERSRAARRATRQAAFNMMLGRRTRFVGMRGALVWTMLHTPLERWMARAFTMRDL